MKKDISTDTKLVSIIGTDIGHSRSPAMMNAAFEELGLDYYYFPMNIKEPDFGDVIRGISKMNFAGLTITIPYKIEVMKYLDEIDPAAEITGAVNTIRISGGKMKGYNTDGEGFVRGLEKDRGVDAAASSFVMFGAGGVARAILTALAFRKAEAGEEARKKKIYVVNRTPERAGELCDRVNSLVCPCCVPLSSGENPGDFIREADVLINATNVGMPPLAGETPVDASWLHRELLVADVIYNPLETRLLREAREAGCRTVNGQSLLLHQGGMAFEIWTGREAPTEPMRKAVFR